VKSCTGNKGDENRAPRRNKITRVGPSINGKAKTHILKGSAGTESEMVKDLWDKTLNELGGGKGKDAVKNYRKTLGVHHIGNI